MLTIQVITGPSFGRQINGLDVHHHASQSGWGTTQWFSSRNRSVWKWRNHKMIVFFLFHLFTCNSLRIRTIFLLLFQNFKIPFQNCYSNTIPVHYCCKHETIQSVKMLRLIINSFHGNLFHYSIVFTLNYTSNFGWAFNLFDCIDCNSQIPFCNYYNW